MSKYTGSILLPVLLGVSLIAVLAIAAAGYFYWQNQQYVALIGLQLENKNPPAPQFPPQNEKTEETATTTESITLKVPIVGGGSQGGQKEFTFEFSKSPGDVVTVLKWDENNFNSFTQYAPDARDKGIIIKQGSDTLQISPVFEGAGSALLVKPETIIIQNPQLSTSNIYRLKATDVYGASSDVGGSIYTTQYKEQPADCSAFNPDSGQPYPACISSGAFVALKNSNDALTIVCSNTEADALWCDDIVKSLSVSVKEL